MTHAQFICCCHLLLTYLLFKPTFAHKTCHFINAQVQIYQLQLVIPDFDKPRFEQTIREQNFNPLAAQPKPSCWNKLLSGDMGFQSEKREFIIVVELTLPLFICYILLGQRYYSPQFIFNLAIQLPNHNETHQFTFHTLFEIRFSSETQGGQTQQVTPILIDKTLVPSLEDHHY